MSRSQIAGAAHAISRVQAGKPSSIAEPAPGSCAQQSEEKPEKTAIPREFNDVVKPITGCDLISVPPPGMMGLKGIGEL